MDDAVASALRPSLEGRRVAIVTPRLTMDGGTEVYLHRLLQVQRELGLRVRIVVEEPEPPPADGSLPEVVVWPEAFEESRWPWPSRHRIGRLRQLADDLCGWADWVEFHLVASLDLLRALNGRLPSFLFHHTSRHTCAARGRYLPRSQSCCQRPAGLGCWYGQWREGCLTRFGGSPPSATDLLSAALLGFSSRALAASASRLIFNSEALSRLFQRTVGGVGSKARVLAPPIIMPTGAARARSGDVLFVGRYFQQKGVYDAVRVAAALSGRCLRLYGEGPCEAEARCLAEDLGVTAHFHPWGDAKTIANAMAEASCLLVPTRYFEAWGMVGPEAIAQGCPVAAYDAGGVREWLHPEYGECVVQGDLAALTEAARRQIVRIDSGLDTSQWRAAAEENWGMAAFARRYASLVSEAIADREDR